MVQNYFALIAYQTLPPVTFNILNQTKTLSAAICCYLILGRKQSPAQILALFLLLLSALVIEKMVPLPMLQPKVTNKQVSSGNDEKVKSHQGTKEPKPVKVAAGVIPILIASFISGLGTCGMPPLLAGMAEIY
jgi:UDP-sugar transporter A1/2/3